MDITKISAAYPTKRTQAKSHAEFLSVASLRYKIHCAVARLESVDDLRAVLLLAEVANGKSLKDYEKDLQQQIKD